MRSRSGFYEHLWHSTSCIHLPPCLCLQLLSLWVASAAAVIWKVMPHTKVCSDWLCAWNYGCLTSYSCSAHFLHEVWGRVLPSHAYLNLWYGNKQTAQNCGNRPKASLTESREPSWETSLGTRLLLMLWKEPGSGNSFDRTASKIASKIKRIISRILFHAQSLLSLKANQAEER